MSVTYTYPTYTVVPHVGTESTHRTGQLRGVTVDYISKKLGFKPNVNDDEDKVVNSWGFLLDGKYCSIWDYKGSHHDGAFSTYGDVSVIFGDKYHKEK